MAADDGEKIVLTEQHFINIFKHLMRLYADAHDLDTVQMRQVKVQQYVEWCLHEGHPVTSEDLVDIPEQLKVPRGALEFIWETFQSPYSACQVLQPIWPTLVLSGQPPAKHQPSAILLSVTVLFRDDRVLQMQVSTPWHPEKPITDGFLAALLNSQMHSLADTIGTQGLDRLYQEHAQNLADRLGGATIHKVEIPGVAPPLASPEKGEPHE